MHIIIFTNCKGIKKSDSIYAIAYKYDNKNNMLINTHDITTMIPGNPDGLDILP